MVMAFKTYERKMCAFILNSNAFNGTISRIYFLQTQPQLYEYVKHNYPDLYEKIKAKVADGQWEVDGECGLKQTVT